METSGRPNEGWMTFIPVAVLVGIVMVALGGPDAFMHTLRDWTADFMNGAARWLKNL